MAEINKVIIEKLSHYDAKIQKLCKEALEQSEAMATAAVVEHLKSVVRSLTTSNQPKN
jgi:hypothetical protein